MSTYSDINGCFPFANQGDKQDKLMYRSMPTAFLGPDDINNGVIKPNDTPNYRSLYTWQPGFADKFSGRPEHCSCLYKYRYFQEPICVEPLPGPVWRKGELVYPQEPVPQEPIWRSMGTFSDMPSVQDVQAVQGFRPNIESSENNGNTLMIWDERARNAAAYSTNGAHSNFILQFGDYATEINESDYEKMAMNTIKNALSNFAHERLTQVGEFGAISANCCISNMIKLPSYLFTNNYQMQGNGNMQNGEISIEMRLFKYKNQNQIYTMSGSGLYVEPGVGPPVRVTFGGFLSQGEVKSGQIKNQNQYVLSILLIAGKNVDFKIFVNEFKSILKSNLPNINEYNSSIKSSKKQLNENDEDGGGYISLGMELYPGSLVMSIDRAINLILKL